MECKVSKKEIKPFMSFGKMPLANGFLEKKNFGKEFFFEMEVGFSEKLSLFQLNDHPQPEQMFNELYPFYTGSSESMKKHFKGYADWISKFLGSSPTKLIEIGSNDGTFLNNFKNTNTDFVGFEPSKNVANRANKNQIITIDEFFCLDTINLINNFKKKTDVICAANVICHIPDLTALITTIEELLNINGIFVFEEPYLGSMFEKTAYDQIYDEHIYMFSATSVEKIFNKFDMNLVDIIPQITHGGSMRYVISRKGKREINKRVTEIIETEKKNNLDNISSCLSFKKNCEISRKKLKSKIQKIKESGKRICGYAATSKSTTVLNYCEIDNKNIEFICDTTKEKIGKYSPGKHIPIVSVEHFRKNAPDVAFLFAWNHKLEIFEKEKEFTKKGQWISHVKI